jgi:hypothetical protein
MRTFIVLLFLSLAVGCSSTRPAPAGQISVSIKGEVHHPGRYFVPQGASLAEALQQAGSFTDYAYLKSVEITHRDGAVAHCNFRADGNHFIMQMGIGFMWIALEEHFDDAA